MNCLKIAVSQPALTPRKKQNNGFLSTKRPCGKSQKWMMANAAATPASDKDKED